jgi:hypothetical protein
MQFPGPRSTSLFALGIFPENAIVQTEINIRGQKMGAVEGDFPLDYLRG